MKRKIYIIVLSCFIIACQNNNKSGVSYSTELKKGPSLKDWNCLKIDSDRVCVPSNWKQTKQSKYFYYCRLDSLDKNSYFVILKYNKTASDLNDVKYLAITYNALIKGTLEKLIRYSSKKIVFTDKTSYYNQYYTMYNNRSYLTQSTVFSVDNDLYEIAIKSVSADSAKYQKIYPNFLFNFRHNDKPIFSTGDEVKELQPIELSKL